MAEYLAIKNWNKYQPKLKNGKPRRDWIRLDTNRIDDPDFASLSIFERGILTEIMAYSGRSGRWIRNDPQFIGSALGVVPSERHLIRRAIGKLLVSHAQGEGKHGVSMGQGGDKPGISGFLILCNQQNIEEFATQDKTGQYRTKERTIPCPSKPEEQASQVEMLSLSPPRTRTPKPRTEYPEEFLRLWKEYPRTDAKFAAFKAFQKLRGVSTEKIIASIRQHRQLAKWNENGGEYIPYLAKFLNQRRFEDELDAKWEN